MSTQQSRDSSVPAKKPVKKKGSVSLLSGTLIAIAAAAAVGCGGYVAYRHVYGSNGSRETRIAEIAVATANVDLENLFKSAQQSFVHRNGERMATSMEELGENFSIGSIGTIIYREIWYARYGRPESDIPPKDKQGEVEKKSLANPYRYAVLPVQDLESPQLDARTSVVVAVPVAETDVPALVMVAGPVRRDPADFLRKWPVKRVVTVEGCKLLRDRLDAHQPFDRNFADEISKHFEEL